MKRVVYLRHLDGGYVRSRLNGLSRDAQRAILRFDGRMPEPLGYLVVRFHAPRWKDVRRRRTERAIRHRDDVLPLPYDFDFAPFAVLPRWYRVTLVVMALVPILAWLVW